MTGGWARWPRAAGAFVGALALLASVMPAMAHVEQGQGQGLLTGMRHPISALDHVLAMVSVGLWGAQLGPPAVWLLPVTFPVVMAMGGFLALVEIHVPGVEVGIALSVLLLGLMVAFEGKPALVAAAALVGAFAVFHGHAHGTELPQGQSGLVYSLGFVIATGALHGMGIAMGVLHRWPLGRVTLRVAGVVVAFAGSAFLWRALA
jgi:urease accessory protein